MNTIESDEHNTNRMPYIFLKIGVNKDFEKNHPKAFNIAKQMNFSGPDIDKMANYVDTDGMEISEAAQQWLKDHKSKWEKWIK